jgi:hypothetical protein
MLLLLELTLVWIGDRLVTDNRSLIGGNSAQASGFGPVEWVHFVVRRGEGGRQRRSTGTRKRQLLLALAHCGAHLIHVECLARGGREEARRKRPFLVGNRKIDPAEALRMDKRIVNRALHHDRANYSRGSTGHGILHLTWCSHGAAALAVVTGSRVGDALAVVTAANRRCVRCTTTALRVEVG